MFKPELAISLKVDKSLGYKDGAYRNDVDDRLEENIQKALELGFSAIDFSFGSSNYSWTLEDVAIKACNILRKYDIKLNGIHIPCNMCWVDLCCPWEIDTPEIIKGFGKFFKIFDEFKPRAFIFHPGGQWSDEQYESALNILCDTADKLAELTDAYVCIENMSSGFIQHTSKQVKDFCDKTKKAQVVFDTNHIFDIPQHEFIYSIGNRIKTLHVSDYDFVRERHWLPLEGKIDWMKVLEALERVGYDGYFLYEVAVSSAEGQRGYSLEKIKENYLTLMKMYSEYKKA